VALETELSLREARDVVQAVFAQLRAEVEPIAITSTPLDALDAGADVAVVGRRSTITHVWAVQVYLYALGSSCGVELVASGESGFHRAIRAARSTLCFDTSVRRMDVLVAELRARDPRVQVIG
jgi:hypothetical protein